MLHIILFLMKIIGIILGIVVGIVLLFMVLILFVPVRYKVHILTESTEKMVMRVGWLLGIIHFTGYLRDKQLKYCLRIFGVPIKQNIKRKKNKKTSEKLKSKNDVENNTGYGKMIEEEVFDKGTNKIRLCKQETDSKKTNVDSISQKDNRSRKRSEQEKTSKSKKRGPLVWIRSKIVTIKKKIQQIGITLKKIIGKWKIIVKLLKDETTKASIKKIKKSFIKLFRYIGPEKINGYLILGMEDPSATGIILGWFGVLKAWYGNKKMKIVISPDFERKVFQTDVKIRGKFRGICLLVISLKLILNKDFKTFINNVKILKEEF